MESKILIIALILINSFSSFGQISLGEAYDHLGQIDRQVRYAKNRMDSIQHLEVLKSAMEGVDYLKYIETVYRLGKHYQMTDNVNQAIENFEIIVNAEKCPYEIPSSWTVNKVAIGTPERLLYNYKSLAIGGLMSLYKLKENYEKAFFLIPLLKKYPIWSRNCYCPLDNFRFVKMQYSAQIKHLEGGMAIMEEKLLNGENGLHYKQNIRALIEILFYYFDANSLDNALEEGVNNLKTSKSGRIYKFHFGGWTFNYRPNFNISHKNLSAKERLRLAKKAIQKSFFYQEMQANISIKKKYRF